MSCLVAVQHDKVLTEESLELRFSKYGSRQPVHWQWETSCTVETKQTPSRMESALYH